MMDIDRAAHGHNDSLFIRLGYLGSPCSVNDDYTVATHKLT